MSKAKKLGGCYSQGEVAARLVAHGLPVCLRRLRDDEPFRASCLSAAAIPTRRASLVSDSPTMRPPSPRLKPKNIRDFFLLLGITSILSPSHLGN